MGEGGDTVENGQRRGGGEGLNYNYRETWFVQGKEFK